MINVEIKGKIIGQGRTKICVPLTGKTKEDILSQADSILSSDKAECIDIVEFRGDYFEGLQDMNALKDVLKALKNKFVDIILLFTIRSEAEGGEHLEFATPTIQDINAFVIENELADMVDVELFSGDEICTKIVTLAREHGVHIIMSNHDFKATPSVAEIVSRLTKMQSLGASVAKIAVMPNDTMQVADLLKATSIMKELHQETPVVSISMGQLGTISRVTGELFGSSITFATLEHSSAPGQLPVSKASQIMELLRA